MKEAEKQQQTQQHAFTSEQLLRAIAPIDQVIDAILREGKDCDDKGKDSSSDLFDVECQHRFVYLIRSVLGNYNNYATFSFSPENEHYEEDENNNKSSATTIVYTPTRRYIKKLVLRFVSRLERENSISMDVEDEDLASLLAEQLQSGGNFGMMPRRSLGAVVDDAPDPMESCHLSFHVPSSTCYSDDNNNTEMNSLHPKLLLGIRVYPHHNDVGVSRIWEAGCCLAEYLLQYPQYVKHKRVVEFGAGVGLTGLVAAGSCGATSVHMTDYTKECLENLDLNVRLNEKWLLERRGNDVEVFEGVTTVRCV